MGLDIARSLGRRGIPVYGIDPCRSAVAGRSRYCRLVVCPDPSRDEEAYVEFLLEWGRQQRQRAVLYPVSDETVLLCSRERERLRRYYAFVMPDHDRLVDLSTKARLARIASECAVPVPQTVLPSNESEMLAMAPHLDYPVLLKPVESSYWHKPEIAERLRQGLLAGRPKVVVCSDPASLLCAYREIARFDPRMIVQALVPGPDQNLAYISFYLNRKSEPLAMFAGRKLRVIPPGFGSASYVQSFHDPDLVDVALRLLRGARFQGLGGLEFKRDSRDGRYKLIEFNTRFGMWDGLAVRCGVDTPYIAYADALGLEPEHQYAYREGIIWWDWQRDLRALYMYRRLRQLTFRQWLRSLRGEKMHAIYSCEDWRPGVAFTVELAFKFFRRLAGLTSKPNQMR